MILRNEKIKVTTNQMGAELASIINNSNKTEYLWQGDVNYWKGRAPILFPFVGRLKDNKYIYQNTEYSVAQHGFARNSNFSVIEHDEAHVLYRLDYTEETLQQYPFRFRLDVEYRLEENSIVNDFTVTNLGENDMPFGLGGHPGFNCPLFEGEAFDDYYLEFEKPEAQQTYRIIDGLFSNERTPILNNEDILNLNSGLFSNDALILEDLNSKHITIKSKKNQSSIRVSVENWKYVGIWTRENNAPFICIEPWTSTADNVDSDGDITKKRGIKILSSGEHYKNRFIIEIE